ncbi:TIGR02444 family protein [Bradyrhizobium canariense]|uniref:TIGR02444 family protein n=1 Tax=Bradyrhizobium canariense TaxID=255045 RepID=A0A1H2BDX3_9BRAD|nr:TIGR02444 family protein [Bradyrhizobium canariense]SDT56089.1 TIGR02444 family protein [Bradyrhizobium canariense]
MNRLAEDQACWDFVVDLYAKPGVAQACLELQERLGVDVSLLLTALFYAVRGGLDLSAEQIEKLDRRISGWRAEAIFPLRRLRRRLKSGDLSSQPTDEFYRRIKADELLAEQIEISALVQQLEQMPGNPAAPSSRVVIERVIRHFAEASGQDASLVDDQTQRAISILHSSTT